ncbi:MAG: hypothetical protein K6T75_01335 [Acetobacteraceae bacterium]|nr:hypothetical protein [Acetobacteraceae bacterium]
MEKKSPAYTKRQKDLILRALTDVEFRRLLASDPLRALGKSSLTPEGRKQVELVLATVKEVEAKITNLADQLLCLNGPCGIC